MMNGIETLAKDFFANKNVCVQPVELEVNEECYIIDPTMIDTDNDFYSIIPVVVVRIDLSQRIPGRKYYLFRAKGSKMDDKLNVLMDNEVPYYKILENTSPYIIKVNEVLDFIKESQKDEA